MYFISRFFLFIAIGALEFQSECKAQSYYHSPNDTLIAYTFLDGQVTMNITQIHSTDNTLHFRWDLVESALPQDWEANICDNSQCYTGLEPFGETLPVLPGDDGLMLLHCTPHATDGTAVIRYTIYELETPLQVDTLTWIIHTSLANLNTDDTQIDPVAWLHENILHLKGNLEGFDHIKLMDISGRIIFETRMNSESTFLIPLINKSMSWIEFSGNSRVVIKKISLCD